jgi:hypothetical protein
MIRPDFMTPVHEHCRFFIRLILIFTGALEPEEADYRSDLVLFVSFTSDAKTCAYAKVKTDAFPPLGL